MTIHAQAVRVYDEARGPTHSYPQDHEFIGMDVMDNMKKHAKDYLPQFIEKIDRVIKSESREGNRQAHVSMYIERVFDHFPATYQLYLYLYLSNKLSKYYEMYGYRTTILNRARRLRQVNEIVLVVEWPQ